MATIQSAETSIKQSSAYKVFWLTRSTIDDANCFIMFTLRQDEGPGRTDYYIVREETYAVLAECVEKEKLGGFATGFSMSERTHPSAIY